jgi:predicted amidophosphoribosyltransferase
MDSMSLAVPGVICAVVIVASLLGKHFFSPEKKCPDCGEPLPRLPVAILGGCACRRCGCEVDIQGRKILTDPVVMLERLRVMQEQLRTLQAMMERLEEKKNSN